MNNWIVLFYGILQISLAVYGYYSAGSLISLCVGGVFGIASLVCSWLMFQKRREGAIAALFLTAVLTVLFAIRYSATGKHLPGLLAVLSGAVLLLLLIQNARWRKVGK